MQSNMWHKILLFYMLFQQATLLNGVIKVNSSKTTMVTDQTRDNKMTDVRNNYTRTEYKLDASADVNVFAKTERSGINDEVNKWWRLSIDKAKTVVKASTRAERVLKRTKRWGLKSLWGEEEEEEEESSNERTRACQARCWGTWAAGTHTSCSVSCGASGQRIRYRKVVDRGCSCPGLNYKVESCGNSCQNGGTLRANDCACPPAYKDGCCQTRVTCGNPGAPPHGDVNPTGSTHYYDTIAQYSCDAGWEITGGTNPRRCQSNGQWTGSVPGCTRISCPHPNSPADGSVAPPSGYVYETLVHFSCHPGFRLMGSETSVCNSNAQWSHTTPTCQRISCGNPGNIANGNMIGNNFKFEDIVRYTCQTGFSLIGSSERECQADATWSCDPPRCVSSISLVPKCPALTQILHGSVTTTDDNQYQE